MNRRRHKAVVVRVGKRRAQIDRLIAPLIREIWKAGIATVMSCQEGEPEKAWIEFSGPEELVKFLNIVAEYEDGVDTLYNRIIRMRSGTTSVPDWDYAVYPADGKFFAAENGENWPTDFWLSVSVYFPQSDLPVLLQRLRKHNAATARVRCRA